MDIGPWSRRHRGWYRYDTCLLPVLGINTDAHDNSTSTCKLQTATLSSADRNKQSAKKQNIYIPRSTKGPRKRSKPPEDSVKAVLPAGHREKRGHLLDARGFQAGTHGGRSLLSSVSVLATTVILQQQVELYLNLNMPNVLCCCVVGRKTASIFYFRIASCMLSELQGDKNKPRPIHTCTRSHLTAQRTEQALRCRRSG